MKDRRQINTHSCGSRWTGHQKAHCAGCHLTFSSDSAFDTHRRGMRCNDPSTMKRKDGTSLLALKVTEFGPIWSHPGSVPTDVVDQLKQNTP